MPISISSRFAFELDLPTDALLQFEAAHLPEQQVIGTAQSVTPAQHHAEVSGHDNIGTRIWLRSKGRVEVQYDAVIAPRRLVHPLANLVAMPPHRLPGEAVQYLLDSAYCRGSKFLDFTAETFGETQGGERVLAIRDWIAANIQYTPGISHPGTDAVETFHARRGICRDFAHVFVTLARASSIPARYVACYAPGVTPQDFHAVSEVFLADPEQDGAGVWQLVDATGMADPRSTVKIGIGRDAADVSFLTTFGPMVFEYSEVKVARTD